MESAPPGLRAMSHSQVLRAMSGLLLAMFVAASSATIVVNALPRIIVDLGGRQDQYTWIIVATLLAATASGPIWGKLADRKSKKLLVQLSLSTIFVGTVLAGLSPTTEALIGFRVIQGVGGGGLMALVHIVIAALVSPRERGRYLGYISGVATVAIVAGPPLGGLIVDAPLLGWRWCFWVGAPIAIVALVLLQKTLDLPVTRTDTKIDWRGALLIPGGISMLLIWLTLAGGSFGWLSWTSAALVGASVGAITLAVVVERRVADPIVPPRLLRDRVFILSIVANATIGVPMIAALAFFAQYFQTARGYGPTQSGLLILPMMVGLVLATMVCGRLVERDGLWKRYVVIGSVLVVASLVWLATIDRTTSLLLACTYATVLGIGLGASLPYLMIAVQNELDYSDQGAGTSMVMFFRTLGGAAGVSVLGAVFADNVTSSLINGLPSVPNGEVTAVERSSEALNLSMLSGSAREVVQNAYADATAVVFLIAACIAFVGFVSSLFISQTRLRGGSPRHVNVNEGRVDQR